MTEIIGADGEGHDEVQCHSQWIRVENWKLLSGNESRRWKTSSETEMTDNTEVSLMLTIIVRPRAGVAYRLR